MGRGVPRPDGPKAATLAERKALVRARLEASRDAGHFETVTEIAAALNLAPGNVLLAVKSLEKDGLAAQAGVALNGGRTWRAVDTVERRS